MALRNLRFATNRRLQAAADNSPVIRRDEPDKAAVAILQRALVELGYPMPRSTRTDGSMDGSFGGETEKAVRALQKRHGLLDRRGQADGIVGRNTMATLDRVAPGLMNIDVVDRSPNDTGFLTAVRRYLGDEILASNVPDMVRRILARLGERHRIERLRVFGHGNYGMQAMGGGIQPDDPSEFIILRRVPPRSPGHHTAPPHGLHRLYGELVNQADLVMLSGHFDHNAWSEFHGCHVAGNRRGTELLQRLSRLWGVPIKAGLDMQYPGGGLERPFVVVWPGGRTEVRR